MPVEKPRQSQPGLDSYFPGRTPRLRIGPLAGLRVADFCWMGVGATATRFLADFGAEVIRIEDRNHLDIPRRLPFYKGQPRTYGEQDVNPDPNLSGHFSNLNRNKLGVTINMRTDKGRALAERLVASSSVVTENFAPGVMDRWGLTYERLKELSPNVIFARMSGFGHSGPDADYRSYGPVVQAICGMSHIGGLPGREPSGLGYSYMDNMAAYYNAVALLTAIYHRNNTGEGTEIDVSAVEAGVNLLGPILLEVAATGKSTRVPDYPKGNRLEHPDAAPHGVYPCVGIDRWIAIAVFDEREWDALTATMDSPSWASDPKFSSQAARFANQDELDDHIAKWTKDHDRHALMHALQRAGVPAAAVQDAEDINEDDPQIASRDAFFELDHPMIGSARFEGMPADFSRTVQDNWRSGALLGEDNAYVFKKLLGVTDDEYADLEAEEAL